MAFLKTFAAPTRAALDATLAAERDRWLPHGPVVTVAAAPPADPVCFRLAVPRCGPLLGDEGEPHTDPFSAGLVKAG